MYCAGSRKRFSHAPLNEWRGLCIWRSLLFLAELGRKILRCRLSKTLGHAPFVRDSGRLKSDGVKNTHHSLATERVVT